MSIMNHVWGRSRGADAVWSFVAGYDAVRSSGRLFMTLQAVIDDSRDEDGVFVLAGYISSAEMWAEFCEEWEKLLPLTKPRKSGQPRFKMAEMASSPEYMRHVPAFFRVIEKHVIASLSVRFSVRDLRFVQNCILVPGIEVDWGRFANPYHVCFKSLMDKFHLSRPQLDFVLGSENKVDFIFDNTSEKSVILSSWDEYIAARDTESIKYYGRHPSFRDDENFPPLQAADFWAWWVRKWHKQERHDRILNWDFDGFGKSVEKKHLRVDILLNQDDLMHNMTNLLRSQIPPDHPIVDLRALHGFRG